MLKILINTWESSNIPRDGKDAAGDKKEIIFTVGMLL